MLHVWVNGVAKKDSIKKMTLSDITFKRDKPYFQKLLQIWGSFCWSCNQKKKKEAQDHIDKKNKEKNSAKKRSPQFERKSGSLLENVNESKGNDLFEREIRKKRRNKSRSSKKMFNQQMKFQKS